jgi:hypothetical protein
LPISPISASRHETEGPFQATSHVSRLVKIAIAIALATLAVFDAAGNASLWRDVVFFFWYVAFLRLVVIVAQLRLTKNLFQPPEPFPTGNAKLIPTHLGYPKLAQHGP